MDCHCGESIKVLAPRRCSKLGRTSFRARFFQYKTNKKYLTNERRENGVACRVFGCLGRGREASFGDLETWRVVPLVLSACQAFVWGQFLIFIRFGIPSEPLAPPEFYFLFPLQSKQFMSCNYLVVWGENKNLNS